jgi:hypothetical protein
MTTSHAFPFRSKGRDNPRKTSDDWRLYQLFCADAGKGREAPFKTEGRGSHSRPHRNQNENKMEQ